MELALRLVRLTMIVAVVTIGASDDLVALDDTFGVVYQINGADTIDRLGCRCSPQRKQPERTPTQPQNRQKERHCENAPERLSRHSLPLLISVEAASNTTNQQRPLLSPLGTDFDPSI